MSSSLGVSLVSLVVAVSSIYYTFKFREKSIRKSVYDDFWFREVFFNPFNSSLRDFSIKWRLFNIKELEKTKQANKFRDELSELYVRLQPLDIIDPQAKYDVEQILDEVSEAPEHYDPSAFIENCIYKIQSNLLETHSQMIKSGYKTDKNKQK